mgnify:CR=1 FL=1|tara:strand:+ start:332 stop:499 length:168 start_codon:yes stop_codon:yes gene_type:complete
MGASKELFMALRQGMEDGLEIERQRRERMSKGKKSYNILKSTPKPSNNGRGKKRE